MHKNPLGFSTLRTPAQETPKKLKTLTIRNPHAQTYELQRLQNKKKGIERQISLLRSESKQTSKLKLNLKAGMPIAG